MYLWLCCMCSIRWETHCVQILGLCRQITRVQWSVSRVIMPWAATSQIGRSCDFLNVPLVHLSPPLITAHEQRIWACLTLPFFFQALPFKSVHFNSPSLSHALTIFWEMYQKRKRKFVDKITVDGNPAILSKSACRSPSYFWLAIPACRHRHFEKWGLAWFSKAT